MRLVPNCPGTFSEQQHQLITPSICLRLSSPDFLSYIIKATRDQPNPALTTYRNLPIHFHSFLTQGLAGPVYPGFQLSCATSAPFNHMDPTDSAAKSSAPGGISSPPASTASPALRQRSSSQSSGHIAAHRQSFVDNQRHPPPPSPRSQRHPSFTQQAIQDLVNNPPTNTHANPRFAGRDWRQVAIGELASPDDVSWAELDTSVEEATMVYHLQRARYPQSLTCDNFRLW